MFNQELHARSSFAHARQPQREREMSLVSVHLQRYINHLERVILYIYIYIIIIIFFLLALVDFTKAKVQTVSCGGKSHRWPPQWAESVAQSCPIAVDQELWAGQCRLLAAEPRTL